LRAVQLIEQLVPAERNVGVEQQLIHVPGVPAVRLRWGGV
jgi:hypothetical protein